MLKPNKTVCQLPAHIGGHITAGLPPIVRFMTKQNSIWTKALTMPLTSGIVFGLISRIIVAVNLN